MKTWSLADVFDVFKKVEQLTRPPRRPNHDVDERVSEECRAPDPSDCLSCGKRCTWPAEAVERPDCSCGLGDGVKLREHWSSCAVWDDDQGSFKDWDGAGSMAADGEQARWTDCLPGLDKRLTDFLGRYEAPEHFAPTTEAAKLADMEAEMDRQPKREPVIDKDGMLVLRGASSHASTLDDVVAQLAQLTHFVEDIRNILQSSPAASAPGVSPSEACDIPPSPSEGRSPKPQQ
jgi:hypothetical protein